MKQEKGITIIALIITIIIMLILVAVVIDVTIDGHLIDSAKHAVQGRNEKVAQTQNRVDGLMGDLSEVEQSQCSHTFENGVCTKCGYHCVHSFEDGVCTKCGKEDVLEPSFRIINPEDPEVTFSTDYGTIEVIWLSGTTNNVSQTPNAPILTEGSNSMIPVKWASNTDASPTETTASDTGWYNYVAGTGTTDNLSSHWANAKTANESYFVWIPRYAYRITYYSDSAKTQVTGYYDGNGMWDAVNEKLRLELEEGIETVTYNGKRYIVHPAFTDCVDMGGWDSDLTGFWVAKYQMSNSYPCMKSIPNATHYTNQNIGAKYTEARNTAHGYSNCPTETTTSAGIDYPHTSYMHSHLIKNSEWGAVAYLTHSQYGRNGNEIDINNSTKITGNGGGSTSATSVSGTTNAYNTELGVKASSTGNIYGIYDLSGVYPEVVAAYNKLGSNTYMEGSTYGQKLTQEAKDNGGNYISTKYATAYNNGTIFSTGKTGDATKEVNTGENYNWHGDNSGFLSLDKPFLYRGGSTSSDYSLAGLFCSWSGSGFPGGAVYGGGYRMCLAL